MATKALLVCVVLLQIIYGLFAAPFCGAPFAAAELPCAAGAFGYGLGPFGYDGIAGPFGYGTGPYGYNGIAGPFGYGAGPFAFDGPSGFDGFAGFGGLYSGYGYGRAALL